MSEQIPLLTDICEAFFARDPHAKTFRTLFWGILESEGNAASQDLSMRLALAAHKSADWDRKKGRPKNGDFNGFVRDLSNREMIYPELKELFGRFHRNIRLATVEKVRVMKAGQLPYYEKLAQQGVRPSDRLPFDGMVWFSVSTDLHAGRVCRAASRANRLGPIDSPARDTTLPSGSRANHTG